MLVAGEWVHGDEPLEVHHPYDGSLVETTTYATEAQVEEAVAAATPCGDEFAATPAHVRAAALDHVSRRLAERAEEIAQLISAENGKPIKWARGEVGRAVSVFRFAAEEARRFNGGEAAAARHGRRRPRAGSRYVRRVPKGPVLGDRAVQLPAQPVRPQGGPGHRGRRARSSSSPPRRPRCPALILGELLAETDLPAGSWSVLPVANDQMPGPGRRTSGCPSSPSPAPARSATRSRSRCRASTSPWSSAATPRPSSWPTGRATRTSTGPRPGSRPSPTTRPASPASPCSA